MFGLENNKFVDYMIDVQIPELTNSKDTDIYRKVSVEELLEYSVCFKRQFALKKPKQEINVVEVDDSNKALLSRLCVFQHNDMFFLLRDVIHFSANSFFIITPNYYKYRHPARAELDLADVTEQIMSDAGGEQ